MSQGGYNSRPEGLNTPCWQGPAKMTLLLAILTVALGGHVSYADETDFSDSYEVIATDYAEEIADIQWNCPCCPNTCVCPPGQVHSMGPGVGPTQTIDPRSQGTRNGDASTQPSWDRNSAPQGSPYSTQTPAPQGSSATQPSGDPQGSLSQQGAANGQTPLSAQDLADLQTSATDRAAAGAAAGAGLGSGDASGGVDFQTADTQIASVPGLIGDFFGAGDVTSVFTEIVPYSIQAQGTILSGSNGDPNAVIVFETSGSNGPNDFFSIAPGTDLDNNGLADRFEISEPVPPSDAPTSPGPEYHYAGGAAVNPTGTFANGDTWQVDFAFSRQLSVVIPNPGTSGAVLGRAKLAENNSPLPRDRVFFNYSFFDNVPLSGNGVSVHRYTPGVEKTFFNKQMSFEIRTPFASTLDNNIVLDASTAAKDTKFGNLFFAYKALLYGNEAFATSAGLCMTAPTADGLRINLQNGRRLASIDNGAVHIMPFLGWVTRTPQGYFTQGILQVDVDSRGNPVRVNRTGRGLETVGVIQDVTMLYLDVSVGRLFRLERRYITQIAPIFELHYNRSLQTTDSVSVSNFRLGEPKQDIQVLNALAAMNFTMRDRSDVTIGYATPIGNGRDQGFDGELRILWNRPF